MKKNKIMDFFSTLGSSLMMPIAALAACGILLGISGALLKDQVVAALPFLENPAVFYIIDTLRTISGVVFTLIPVLFAISISLGMAKEDKGIAAFAGFVGYYTFLVSASTVVNSGFVNFDSLRVAPILGIETIDMGAVAGILTGIIVAFLHNKYHKIQFPVAIAFYGGKRFVAIVVILVMGLLGQVAPFVWQPVSAGITALGTLIGSAGSVGVFFFGFLERLLIPTGLHHVLNSIFRTTAVGGVYEGVEGCLNIFLQFFDKVDIDTLRPFTQFLGQGKMPFMMFGLPAAALAIYHSSPSDKKDRVKALMIAGVAASIISGITEPLEFSFMFIAPMLFLFHALMGGISFLLMSVLGVAIGNTGGGLIDYIVWGVMQPGSRWYMVLIVGPIYAVLYYFVFKKYLSAKNLSIDVAEEVDEDEAIETISSNGDNSLALQVIAGLGGRENIKVVNNCISRLRVDIGDMNLVQESILKKTGSLGIIKPSETHIQVVYGPKIEKIADAVRKSL
ncbi:MULTISPECIES: PTS transporter subunit EIIC [Enterococcus]|uniref:PTS transporter subunit EIIC n=1 Tax=Candidatus Enterococcus murrayae TaxID=2815321 RepID=A0ABS3HJE0_9ENTE|nr:PTS transporter subunit EIIC [Enterococcus sp. MJM16]MBO0452673.1 PTS transporter subunit EIIC [Enterococcus sp. MJM16]